MLKVRSGTSRTNEILSGIQFKTYFIKFFLVETKRFVSSFVNVILTWQTCSQRSKRAAESKRRALGNDFSERICYMFPRSKCRGDWDLGLCTTSGLAFGEPQHNSKIQFFGLLEKKCVSTQEKSDFAIALRFSKRKSRSCKQTLISVSSTFWY